MRSPFRVPGQFEVEAARRFFFGLSTRNREVMGALLGDHATFENIDGPVAVDCREALAGALAARGSDVDYELVDVEGSPGEARARFLLFVEGVPGAVLLRAVLLFEELRIVAIRVDAA